MVKIYVSPSCSSCRKVKEWFKAEKIPFTEVNILNGDLTIEDLKDILTKSLDGTDEIISTRSKIIKENNIDLNSMSLNELLEFIKKNPTVLKRPIMVDDKKIQVGYNPEEIRVFIPRARRIAQSMCSHENCPTFDTCPHLKDIEENNK